MATGWGVKMPENVLQGHNFWNRIEAAAQYRKLRKKQDLDNLPSQRTFTFHKHLLAVKGLVVLNSII